MKQKRPLLICGSGRSLFADLAAMSALAGGVEPAMEADYDIMAVNDAYLALPVVHHLVSYHDELLFPWLMIKGPRFLNNGVWQAQPEPPVVCHSQREGKAVDRVWVFEEGGGSSSFFGVQIALELGYERIVLCGVPFDASGRFYFPPWQNGHDYAGTDGWEIWEKWHAEGKLEAVRSMSGRTRTLLGQPEREWLWQ